MKHLEGGGKTGVRGNSKHLATASEGKEYFSLRWEDSRRGDLVAHMEFTNKPVVGRATLRWHGGRRDTQRGVFFENVGEGERKAGLPDTHGYPRSQNCIMRGPFRRGEKGLGHDGRVKKKKG